MASYDVIIAGAGIIGLSLALELHEGGAHVLVLERGRPGGEASSAAAGMLAATDPETPMPLRALAIESAHLFPVFVEKLESATRVDVDFRRHGTIVLSKEETMPENYQPLSGGELQKLEPNLAGGGHNAYFVAEDSVDPASLMTAALRSAAQRGVEVRSGTACSEDAIFRRSGGDYYGARNLSSPRKLSTAVVHGPARPSGPAKGRRRIQGRQIFTSHPCSAVARKLTLCRAARERFWWGRQWKMLV